MVLFVTWATRTDAGDDDDDPLVARAQRAPCGLVRHQRSVLAAVLALQFVVRRGVGDHFIVDFSQLIVARRHDLLVECRCRAAIWVLRRGDGRPIYHAAYPAGAA